MWDFRAAISKWERRVDDLRLMEDEVVENVKCRKRAPGIEGAMSRELRGSKVLLANAYRHHKSHSEEFCRLGNTRQVESCHLHYIGTGNVSSICRVA